MNRELLHEHRELEYLRAVGALAGKRRRYRTKAGLGKARARIRERERKLNEEQQRRA